MDFSRARTVLIWVFLFLNFFLVYQIWQGEGGGSYIIPGWKEEASRLETALQEAGFSLETTLPRGGARLAHLVVKPGEFAVEEFIYPIWQALENGRSDFPAIVSEKDSAGEKGSAGQETYYFGEYCLHAEKKGLLVLEANKKGVLQQKNAAGEKLFATLQDFIRKEPCLEGFIYDYARETQQGTVIHYRQGYEGFPLYGGFLELMAGREGDFVFTLYRLEPLGFAAQTREVISPAAALLRFLEVYGADQAPAKKRIIDVALGYYSCGYDAEKWEIPPVWRIRLHNGEVYYINAFTGNLEK
ncbi:MAG: two-component system regulatory protein YycI [Dethiobacteria bacterium]|jgi:regulatory protein YycI of two-component signal transduction system YycFG